ncbi:MAG: CBASS cGAMP synthase [Bacteroidota bacterium]
MADCHDLFQGFNNRVRLTDAKRENLKEARDVLRNKITIHFSQNRPSYRPQFQGQGSYVMDTIVNPIKWDYDLDDGVYFLGTASKENRPTPVSFHNWIIEAIGTHTDKVIDKNTCVRVVYSAGFHIDLPIYYASYYSPELAHKRDGWILSNPIEFIVWFESKTNSGFKQEFLFEAARKEEFRTWAEDVRKKDVQLRRMVRYLKGWCDYKNGGMPSGIIMTILAAGNYVPDQRDDMSLYRTLEAIRASLKKEFVCRRPTTPKGEDLFAEYTVEQKSSFSKRLDDLIEDGKRALNDSDKKNACEKWKIHFGDRFPCHLVSTGPTIGAAIYEPLRDIAKTSTPWYRK